MIQIKLPDNAKKIMDTLHEHGYEAYIVGGCVRDSILGKEPKDWDITTSATPQETKALFRRTIDTGIEHGTVTVMFGKEGYEVTTYRVDGKYADHRRPDRVTFTASLEEDLKRRDFTINAMAYDYETGLVDLFGGVADLNQGIIRCVGDASARFDEDALRMLRAVRFAAQLNFQIAPDTGAAIQEKAIFLKEISAERIQVELSKLLLSPHPEKLIDAYQLGMTAIVLPEFDKMMETQQNNPHHMYNVGEHSIEVAKHVKPDMVLRWTAILHDSAKPLVRTVDEKGIDHFHNHEQEGVAIAKEVLKRLKLDNNTIARVARLVEWHDYGKSANISKKTLRKALNKMGTDLFDDYIAFRYGDVAGQSDYRREEKIANIKRVEALYQEIMEEKSCLTVKELALNGTDLIQMGMKPGKEIGYILDRLLQAVLDEPTLNTREKLTELVQRIKS